MLYLNFDGRCSLTYSKLKYFATFNDEVLIHFYFRWENIGKFARVAKIRVYSKK